MSSYDKVVKLACKPKAAPPKAKYIDTIITATYSEDGAIHDVCKALAPKFREPNAIIVFKALIVLHTMIRNGSTDNVLAHLSQADILRLKNVGNDQWEGYAPPRNLTNYAIYLDYRIRAYKDLKHDPIRVQSENNRDLLAGQIEEEGRRSSLGFGNASASATNNLNTRRQTIVGRKLKIMTVEKGLLRETKIVQKMIDILLECKFYLDDLEDQLTITALRILVKDILVLSQACNEGVANLLEHYFEMSHIDATSALSLYRHFCSQAEAVQDYLVIAKKLQNLLNVPIPEMNHAPISLAGSLEEYLNDPNFEQNRIEYKTNKESAERNARAARTAGRRKPETETTETKPSVPHVPVVTSEPVASASSTTPAKKDAMDDVNSFFASIEDDQKPTASGQVNSPFAQQSVFNPFAPQQSAMATGMHGGPSPFSGGAMGSPFVNVQPTGFPSTNPFPGFGIQAQATGFPGQAQQPGVGMNTSQSQPSAFLSPSGNLGVSPFARPQSAAPNFGGAPGLQPLQAQTTGANPFRQSFLAPHATGLPFVNQPTGAPFLNPTATSSPFAMPPQSQNPFPFLSSPGNDAPSNSPFATSKNSSSAIAKVTPPFARPASTPITSNVGDPTQVVSHQTGSRNPFGRPKSPPPPPVPSLPTMGQLANGGFNNGLANGNGSNGQLPFGGTNPTFAALSGSGNNSPFAAFNATGSNGNPNPNGTTSASINGAAPNVSLSSVASEFTFDQKPRSPPPSSTAQQSTNWLGNSAFSTPQSAQNTSTTSTTNGTFSTFSANPTGSSSATTPSTSFLKPQPTGFGGSAIKPFKPSSSFGTTLLDSLPTIPQGTALSTPNSSSSPAPGTFSTGTNPNQSIASGLSGALNSQPTGLSAFSGFGSGFSNPTTGGLQPQSTGANPFRAPMFGGPGSPTIGGSSAFSSSSPGLTANATGLGASLFANANSTQQQPSLGFNPFGAGSGGGTTQNGTASGNMSMPGAFPTFQQQQNAIR